MNTLKQNHLTFRTILIVLLLTAGIPFLQAQENTDSWEVEIIKVTTNKTVKSGIVHTNSFALEGLEYNVEYFARVRTKNTFLSGWEVSDTFILDDDLVTTSPPVFETGLRLGSDNGLLYISSDKFQMVNIHTVDGCFVRSVSLSAGNTTVVGLAKGLYIVNGRKIIVK